MKKVLILTCLILSLSVFEKMSVYAQTPAGRSLGEESIYFIGPPRDTINYGEPEIIVITNFPVIPYLSSSQRDVIETALVKEQEITRPQRKKEQQLNEKLKTTSIDEKEKNEIQKNIKKIDSDIKSRAKKSNKKIKKNLMSEQYRVFIQKRGEFQYGLKK